MEKFVKVKKIGEGAFGKALLVKRKEDGKHCVIKEIGISKMSPKEREESKKEVKVLSQLKHPNIVSYLESFHGDGNLYIVMDYCDGGDLYKYIANQRGVYMDEGKVMDIFVQCCLAIKHIHDRKILHRDIKTQNIFLTRHCIVKLGDFGIARVLKNTMELARTCIGTPYYLSPEIVENRPYNNKSDIWSLGCVLYELATLKHAFEAGSMKNLVLKIVRGSYPPIPNRYSFELRSLVAQCFKRSPSDRPSVNTILKKPIIQQRIQKYLSPEEVESEFSHTVLHKEKLNMAGRPPAAVVKKQLPAKRLAGPAAVYGVSVAKKPAPVKKPAVGSGARQKKIPDQNVRSVERKREIDARERRRKEIVSQEQQYQEYMNNIQKQRWEKQQANQMNRAREMGWKNTLGTDEKEKQAGPQNKVRNNDPMKKYQPYQHEERKENIQPKVQQKYLPEEKPVSKPANAWVDVKKDQNNQVKADDAQERGRILQDFWQRKRQAADNKAKANNELFGNNKAEENPLLQFHAEQMAAHAKHNAKPPVYPGARNKQEVDYLKQLDAIRRQNYIERKNIQDGGRGQLYQPKQDVKVVGDPRFDPEARKKKIEGLKKQAEERSEMLRKQLEIRKKQAAERIDKERQDRLKKNNEAKNADKRPLPRMPWQPVDIKPKEKVVTPAVGIATAMGQVGPPKLFRSCSEGDLKDLIQPNDKAHRRNWGAHVPAPMFLANMSLEITSSAMEATTASAANCTKPAKASNPDVVVRKQWIADGKTQLVSNLHNIGLSETQMTIRSDISDDNNSIINNAEKVADVATKETEKVRPGGTITLSHESVQRTKAGATIVLSTESDEKIKKKLSETITISPKVNVTSNPSETITLSTKADASVAEDVAFKQPNVNEACPEKSIPVDDSIVKNSEPSKTIVLSSDKQDGNLGLKIQGQNEEQESNLENIELDSLDDQKQAKDDIKADKVPTKMAWTGGQNISDDKLASVCDKEEKVENTHSKEVEEKEIEEKELVEEEVDEEEDDEEEDEDSFHTPNRAIGLRTGCYDAEKTILRTCSLPDLRDIIKSPEESEVEESNPEKCLKSSENDEEIQEPDEQDSVKQSDDLNVEDLEELEDSKENDADKNEQQEIENEEQEQEEEEIEKNEAEDEEVDVNDEEEFEDFESMLESMRDVLKSTAHSPLSTSVPSKTGAEIAIPVEEESNVDDEEWDSDEDNDSNEIQDAESTKKQKELKEAKLKDTLFSRIEESRKALEDELGLETFLKVYRHVQMIQDNEDDELELGTSEISEILGDKEYLYQKILYLVISDAAYCEGNDGLS